MTVDNDIGERKSFWSSLSQARELELRDTNIENLRAQGTVNVHGYLASREHGDLLVTNFFKTFHKLLGSIVTEDDFLLAYERGWRGQSHSCQESVIELLIFLIGNSILPRKDPRRFDMLIVLRWIQSARIWRNSEVEVHKYNFSMLRIDILIYLVRRIYNGHHLMDESTGSASLVRNALAMGLHREAPNDTTPQAQQLLRKSLWYAVLELDVQSSIESGMPPAFSSFSGKDVGNLSGSPLLVRSLPIRLKIAEFLNGSKNIGDLSYDVVCRLHEQLMSVVDPAFSSVSQKPDKSFVEEQQIMAIKRTILALHWTFAIQPSNQKYAFSRNICLVTAVHILDQFFQKSTGQTETQIEFDSYSTTFQNDAFPAALYLYFELIRRHFDLSDLSNPVMQLASLRAYLRKLIDQFHLLAEERLLLGSDYSGIVYVISGVLRRFVIMCGMMYGEESTGFDGRFEDGNKEVLQGMFNQVGQMCVRLMAQRTQATNACGVEVSVSV